MEPKLTKDEKKELRKQEWQEKLQQEQRNTLLKKIALWGGIGLLVVVGIWLLTQAGGTQQSSGVDAPAISTRDLTTGNKNAKVTLIEYADFQCPGCGAYHPIVKQLLKDFNGKIYFAYRYFPLTQLHKNAMAAAQTSYAAHLEGKFWEMHDTLFEHQKDWATLDDPTNVFLSYAKNLNLDINTFTKDMNADSTKKFINDEANKGIEIGVNSTPTFYLNNHKLDNPGSYDAFKQILQSAISK